jgi:hypothetical protein
MTAVRRPGLRSVLASSGYRRLLAAQTISRCGDTVNTVALVVLVFRTSPGNCRHLREQADPSASPGAAQGQSAAL